MLLAASDPEFERRFCTAGLAPGDAWESTFCRALRRSTGDAVCLRLAFDMSARAVEARLI